MTAFFSLLIATAVVAACRAARRAVEARGEDWSGTMCASAVQRKKAYNPGLFLGFLKGNTFAANLVSGAAMCAVAVYTVVRGFRGMAFAAKLGWGLLLGGGVSNFLERALKGHVTDYFSFCRALPKRLRRVVFNIADICIFAGACLAVIFDR